MFKKFDWSFKSIAKALGLLLGGVIGISILIALLHFSYKTVTSFTQPLLETRDGKGYASEESADAGYFNNGPSSKSLSGNTVDSIYEPRPTYNSGTNAEEFEVKNYYGTIESKNLEKDCAGVSGLKSRADVIFESSNQSEESCYFRFKVKKETEEDILSLIKAMNPKNLTASINTIKAAVEGVSNELEILTKKLQSIEETLTNAQTSYDGISKLATAQNDPETLAKIIDSKLSLIERLTTERLNLKAQIDNYNRLSVDQMDQLDYTFFDLNIYEDIIWDWKEIKENWKFQVREMIQNINEAFQALTLNLLVYIFYATAGVVYIFLTVFLLKFVWLGAKRIWRK